MKDCALAADAGAISDVTAQMETAEDLPAEAVEDTTETEETGATIDANTHEADHLEDTTGEETTERAVRTSPALQRKKAHVHQLATEDAR